jgi:short-subunit dehydrogenase
MKSSDRKRALVTGASSGIGAAFAERLARDGFDLILVARRRARLEALGRRLELETGIEAQIVQADLADRADLARVQAVAGDHYGLDLLVNNAGAGGYMPFLELEPKAAEALLDVHVRALTILSRAALPGMVSRGRGAIINVASNLAFGGSVPPQPLPYRATYAAAKSYVVTFTQGLAHELDGTGVRVQALCPAVVRTEFHDVAGVDRARFQLPVMEPDEVVSASLAGLELGEVVCLPSLEERELIEAADAAQRNVLRSAGQGSLASRYRNAAKASVSRPSP